MGNISFKILHLQAEALAEKMGEEARACLNLETVDAMEFSKFKVGKILNLPNLPPNFCEKFDLPFRASAFSLSPPTRAATHQHPLPGSSTSSRI